MAGESGLAASSGPAERDLVRPVSLSALFIAFLSVALLGFGGGIAWARRITVDQRRWLSEPDFADIVSLCQFMPGPNVVGIAVCTGAKLRGGIGAIAALCGFIVIPWSVGLALGALLLEYGQLPIVRNILGGVSAVAAGLLIAAGLRLFAPHRRHPVAVVFGLLAFILMAFTKLPLLAVLFGLVPLSIAASGIEKARVG
jgi:chromate transporter